jgi:hypothetical protein
VLVELRGFEPLTSAMRTQPDRLAPPRLSPLLTTSAQVNVPVRRSVVVRRQAARGSVADNLLTTGHASFDIPERTFGGHGGQRACAAWSLQQLRLSKGARVARQQTTRGECCTTQAAIVHDNEGVTAAANSASCARTAPAWTKLSCDSATWSRWNCRTAPTSHGRCTPRSSHSTCPCCPPTKPNSLERGSRVPVTGTEGTAAAIRMLRPRCCPKRKPPWNADRCKVHAWFK